MSNFWQSGSGKPITGAPEDAFLHDFGVIPEGSMADAMIKTFINVERVNTYNGTTDRYLEIIWKLINGNFKNREVSQKIKVFNGSPEQIDRNLNMLKLIMQLCNFQPTHAGAPTDGDLAFMQDKTASIKVGEWSLPKKDGSGMMEGNFVREVSKAGSSAPETGIKTVVTHNPSAVESAFSRTNQQNLDIDIPF